MTLYLIQTSVGFIIFYTIYHLIFANLTFFRLNRIFLLASLVFSLVFPWLAQYLEGFFLLEAPKQIFQMMADEIVIHSGEGGSPDVLPDTPWYVWILPGIYISGAGFVFVRLLYGLLKIYQLYQGGQKTKEGNYTIIETRKDHVPFSFFHIIFIKSYDREDSELKTILKHETLHAREWHSLDILFVEIIQVLYWFLPVIPLYKRAVRQIHECLADEDVCCVSDRNEYIRILLQEQKMAIQLQLGNQFFQSQIKQRLIMMTKKKSQGYSRLMYVLFLPVAAGLMMCLGFTPLEGKTILNTPLQIAVADTVPSPPAPPAPPKPPKQTRKTAKTPDAAPPPPPPAPVQTAPAPPPPPPPPAPPKGEEIFKMVEEMPRFKHEACESLSDRNEKYDCAKGKFMEYLISHLVYPEAAKKDSIEGSVVVQFIINKKGSMVDFNIVRDIGNGCGRAVEQSLRELLGKENVWIPGRQLGKQVNVLYTLPVKFKLD